ncbi:hypothetical protein CYMTET_49254 [Cymbomonas tetramitiformis]|uniref:TNFR-Cys domain-containing protein n=1 Tax=Cymbomonas tetramitiformis TaxID=36881 RepID=A0AAE0BS78_9CHLO|nr:hypothetical protein CYMTET_49254 [Cymbomonas tetramitiformis]
MLSYIALTLLFLYAQKASSQSTTVKLGQVTPEYCAKHRDGVALAVELINAQNGGRGFKVGYSGQHYFQFEHVSVVIPDGTQADYEQLHRDAVSALLEEHDPGFIVGSCSQASGYEKDLVNAAQKILLAQVGPNAYYEDQLPYIFGMHISSYRYTEPALKLLSFEGAKTVAIAGREHSLFFNTTCSSAEQYALEFGLSLAMPRVVYPGSGTESKVGDVAYQRQLATDIALAAPDIIIGCVGNDEANVWVQTWEELGIEPKAVWLTCTTWGWPAALGLNAGNGSYMLGAGQWHADMTYTDPLVGTADNFLQLYEEKFGYSGTYDSVASYTIGYVYMRALQKAFLATDVEDPEQLLHGTDYESIRRSLETFSEPDTLYGPVAFDATYQRNVGRQPATSQFLPLNESTGVISDQCVAPLDVASAQMVYPSPGASGCRAGTVYDPSNGQCLLCSKCTECTDDKVCTTVVKLGQVTPEYCAKHRDGVALAVELINAQNGGRGFKVGYSGQHYFQFEHVSVVIPDGTQADYEQLHRDAVSALLEEHDPGFIVGSCSQASGYEKDLVNAAQKILLAQVGPNAYYEDQLPYIFGMHISSYRYTEPALKLLSFEGAKTVAIAGREHSLFFNTTCSSAEQYALEYGLSLAMPRVVYPGSGTESKVGDVAYQRQLATDIALAAPDIIIGCVGNDEANVWVQTWEELGIEPKAVWLTCTTWGWPAALGLNAGNGSYMLGAGQWHADMTYTDPLVGTADNFLQLYEEKFGYSGTYDSVASYTIGYVYMRALQKAFLATDVEDPEQLLHGTDYESIRRSLETFSEPDTLYGPVAFDATYQRNVGRQPATSQFLPLNESTGVISDQCVAPLDVASAQMVYPSPGASGCRAGTVYDPSNGQCLLCSKCTECTDDKVCTTVVKLGQVTPEYCAKHRDGVALAVELINAQNGGRGFKVGYSGQHYFQFEHVSVVIPDGTQADYEQLHRDAVSALLEEHDPGFIVGSCSQASGYEKDLVNAAQKILLAQVGPNAYYEDQLPYIFGMHISSYRYTEPALKLLSFEGAKTVAIAGREHSLFFNTTCSSAEQYALEYGLSLAMPRVVYPGSGTESKVGDVAYQRQLATDIALAAPDIIIGCVGNDEANVWVQTWEELGIEPKAVWLTCTTWGWPAALGLNAGNGSYMLGAGQWHADMTYTDPLVGTADNFLQLYEEKFGYSGTYDSVASYTIGYVYMRALQKAFLATDVEDPEQLLHGTDYESIRRSLETFSEPDTLYGPVAFDATYQRNVGRQPATSQFLPLNESTGVISDQCVAPLDVASAQMVYPSPGASGCRAGTVYDPSNGQCLLCSKCTECTDDKVCTTVVKLGQVTPEYCAKHRDGVALAVELINAQNGGRGFKVGYSGQHYFQFEHVSVVIPDGTQADYEQLHRDAVSALLEEHDPGFIVGSCSQASGYEKDLVNAAQKILLAQVGPNAYYEDQLPYIFGMHISSYRYTEPALKLLSFEGAKTVAIAGREHSLFFNTTCSSAEQYALEYGLSLAMPRVVYPGSGTESKVGDVAYQRQLATDIALAAPDIIIGCVGNDEANVWVQTWEELGIEPKAVWLTCTTWGWPAALGLNAGNGSYMLGAGQWHADMTYTDPLVGTADNFLQLYEEKFGYSGTYDSVASYTIGYVYMRALQKAFLATDVEDPEQLLHGTDYESIRRSLETFSEPDTLYGPVAFDATYQRNVGRQPATSQFLPLNESTGVISDQCVAPLDVASAQMVYPSPGASGCRAGTVYDPSNGQCLLCSKCTECTDDKVCTTVVKLGQVTPEYCAKHRDGVALAVELINAQNGGRGFKVGYSGQHYFQFEHVSVVIPDGTQADYEQLHRDAVSALLEEHDPGFIVGSCSQASGYEKDLVNAAQKILLAQVGPNAYYEDQLPYIFGMHISSYRYTEPALKLLSFEGAKTVAIAGREHSLFFNTTCSSAEQYALEYGLSLAMPRVVYPGSGTESKVGDVAYQRQLATDIALAAPDIIIGCVGNDEANVWVQTWEELGIEPKAVWLTCTTWGWPAALGLNAGNGSYMLGAGQWHADMTYTDPLVGTAENFLQLYEEKFGYSGTYDSVASYTIGYVYMRALQKAFISTNVEDPDALLVGEKYESIRRSMEMLNERDTLYGPVAFDSTYQRNVGRQPATSQILPLNASTSLFTDMCVAPLDVARAQMAYPAPGADYCAAGEQYDPSQMQCLLCSKCVECDDASEDCCAKGNFVDPVTGLCVPCPAGSYSTRSGVSACTPCGLGEYQPFEGSSTGCLKCGPGEFADQYGSAGCQLCEPGHYNALSGREQCERCGFAEYQEEAGATECMQCPEHTNNWQPINFIPVGGVNQYVPASRLECMPQQGYFGEPGALATACSEGGTCCECPASDSDDDLMARMAADPTSFCSCVSGTRFPFPQPGHVRSLRDDTTMLACPQAEACLGAPRLYRDSGVETEMRYGECEVGYGGRLCGGCDAGEGYYAMDRKCEQCQDKIESQVFYFIVLMLIMITAMTYAVRKGAIFFKNGAISVLCDFAQMQSLFYTYDLNWPTLTSGVLASFSIMNLNIDMFGAACLFPSDLSWYDSCVMKMMMPLMIVAGFGAVYLVFYVLYLFDYYDEMKHQLHTAHCVNATLFAISFMYSYMADTSLSIFHCIEFDDGSTYLYSYPELECGTPEYWRYAGTLGFLGIMGYATAVPVVWFWFLRKNKAHLRDPIFKKHYGALYVVYTEDFYYWEVIVKLKKLVTLVVVIFLPNNLAVQVLSGVITMLAIILLGSVTYPMRFAYNNSIDTVATAGNYLTLIFGFYFWSEKLDDNEHTLMTSLFLMSNIVVVAIIVHAIVYEYIAHYLPKLAATEDPAAKFLVKLLLHPIVDKAFQSKRLLKFPCHWSVTDEYLGEKIMNEGGEQARRERRESSLNSFNGVDLHDVLGSKEDVGAALNGNSDMNSTKSKQLWTTVRKSMALDKIEAVRHSRKSVKMRAADIIASIKGQTLEDLNSVQREKLVECLFHPEIPSFNVIQEWKEVNQRQYNDMNLALLSLTEYLKFQAMQRRQPLNNSLTSPNATATLGFQDTRQREDDIITDPLIQIIAAAHDEIRRSIEVSRKSLEVAVAKRKSFEVAVEEPQERWAQPSPRQSPSQKSRALVSSEEGSVARKSLSAAGKTRMNKAHTAVFDENISNPGALDPHR